MVDITQKQNTHRFAAAEAVVRVSTAATIKAIEEKRVPKGDVFVMSRAAGFLGIKKTSELLPDCHPLPIEFAAVEYSIGRIGDPCARGGKNLLQNGSRGRGYARSEAWSP